MQRGTDAADAMCGGRPEALVGVQLSDPFRDSHDFPVSTGYPSFAHAVFFFSFFLIWQLPWTSVPT